jgi:hypothetical protein
LGTSFPNPKGIWIHGLRSRPPASIRHKVIAGFSVSRVASTHPAEPPPATTTSNSMSNLTAKKPLLPSSFIVSRA